MLKCIRDDGPLWKTAIDQLATADWQPRRLPPGDFDGLVSASREQEPVHRALDPKAISERAWRAAYLYPGSARQPLARLVRQLQAGGDRFREPGVAG